MVVRIFDTARWVRSRVGDVLVMTSDKARRVRLEVNCPAPVRFDLVEGDRVTFLATVTGLEVIEFFADGTVEVVPHGDSDFWYATADGDDVGAQSPSSQSFTRIAQRKARNHDLELMQFKMEQNIMRRMAKQEAEIAELRAAREAAAVQAGADPETGEVSDDDKDGGGATTGTMEPAAPGGASSTAGAAGTGASADGRA